jgi:hypothetical protein
MKIGWLLAAGSLILVPPLRADLYYLDQPAPVSLQHGEFLLSGRLQAGGGVMARAAVGLFNRITLGVSYSVDSLLGSATPRLGPQTIGIQARLLGVEEGTWIPAILAGFESQGYDGYIDSANRFQTLPPGVYLVMAKTFWSTRTEVSAGANYKTGSAPTGFDAHVAVREMYPLDWGFIMEYDLALNDPQSKSTIPGLLNFGVTRTLGSSVEVKAGLRDIFSYHKGNGLNRVLDLAVEQKF